MMAPIVVLGIQTIDMMAHEWTGINKRKRSTDARKSVRNRFNFLAVVKGEAASPIKPPLPEKEKQTQEEEENPTGSGLGLVTVVRFDLIRFTRTLVAAAGLMSHWRHQYGQTYSLTILTVNFHSCFSGPSGLRFTLCFFVHTCIDEIYKATRTNWPFEGLRKGSDSKRKGNKGNCHSRYQIRNW